MEPITKTCSEPRPSTKNFPSLPCIPKYLNTPHIPPGVDKISHDGPHDQSFPHTTFERATTSSEALSRKSLYARQKSVGVRRIRKLQVSCAQDRFCTRQNVGWISYSVAGLGSQGHSGSKPQELLCWRSRLWSSGKVTS